MATDIPNEAGVCFHERRHGFYSQSYCRDNHDGHLYIGYGRCNSGRRWFWTAYLWSQRRPGGSGFYDPEYLFGWEDTEQQAMQAARDAVIKLANGDKALAEYRARIATEKLKELNAAKRAARVASWGTHAARAANAKLWSLLP